MEISLTIPEQCLVYSGLAIYSLVMLFVFRYYTRKLYNSYYNPDNFDTIMCCLGGVCLGAVWPLTFIFRLFTIGIFNKERN